MSELTDDEKKTFCEAHQEYAEEFAEENKDAVCKLGGVTAGAFAAAFDSTADGTMACEAAVAECTSAPLSMPDGDPVAACKMSFTADCDVTVEQFENCINENFDALEETFAEFDKSCSELLSNTTSSSVAASSSGTACKIIAEKCPSAQFSL